MKKAVLDAQELMHSEIKGQTCFAPYKQLLFDCRALMENEAPGRGIA